MIRILLLLLAACTLVACSPPNPDAAKTDALKRAVQKAHRLFEMTQTDPMANVSFYSLHQMGGTGLHYLTASLDDRGEISCYEETKPSAPWCVVVRNGPGDMDITIEGYGAQTDTPVVSQVARVGAPKRF